MLASDESVMYVVSDAIEYFSFPATVFVLIKTEESVVSSLLSLTSSSFLCKFFGVKLLILISRREMSSPEDWIRIAHNLSPYQWVIFVFLTLLFFRSVSCGGYVYSIVSKDGVLYIGRSFADYLTGIPRELHHIRKAMSEKLVQHGKVCQHFLRF